MSFHGHTAGNPHYCQHSSKAYFIPIMVLCVLCFIYGKETSSFASFFRVEADTQKVWIPCPGLYMTKLGFILNIFTYFTYYMYICSCICVCSHMPWPGCRGQRTTSGVIFILVVWNSERELRLSGLYSKRANWDISMTQSCILNGATELHLKLQDVHSSASCSVWWKQSSRPENFSLF